MSYGKDLLDKLQSNKNKDKDDLLLEETKGSYLGAGIGMAVGLFIGYSRGYSLLMSAFIGATIGGFATRSFIKKKDEDK
jgi:uncharacterized protein YcfJ